MNSAHQETHKSIVLTAYGGFGNIKVIDTALTEDRKPDEIMVRNTFCGVNFADIYTVKGLLQQPTPFTMGLESVGFVMWCGDSVRNIKVGDRVLCYKWIGGLYKDTVVVNHKNCFVIPPEISDEDAVALPANYLTAYISLFKIAKLQPGQSVLIHSCAGGVGWAATQLANTVENVTILGTASSQKHEIVKKNGVKYTMTYENYISNIQEIIPDGKVDYIIDCIGGSNFSLSQVLLKPLGQVILTGCSSFIKNPEIFSVFDKHLLKNSASVEMSYLMEGSKAVAGLHLGLLMDQCPDLISDCMNKLFHLLIQNKIKPRIDSIWPFEKVVDAYSLLADRKNIGKVVLKV